MILNESYQIYAYLLNNLSMKHMPEVLGISCIPRKYCSAIAAALSAEFRSMPFRPEDEKFIQKLRKILVSSESMVKKPCPSAVVLFKRWPNTEKINILLHAHMNRLANSQYLSQQLLGDLDQILRKTPMLVDAMVRAV